MKKWIKFLLVCVIFSIWGNFLFWGSVTAKAEDDDKLTKQEISLYAANPWEAFKAKQCANAARKAAKKYYSAYALEQGNGDAFRHAYWSALMAKKISKEFAYKAGLAHEGLEPGYKFQVQSDDVKMDISNNKKGRSYGVKYSGKSDRYLAKVIKKACDKGRLKRIRIYAGNGVKSDKTIEGVPTAYVGYYIKTNSEGRK